MNWRLGIGSVEHVLADSDGEGDGRRGVRDRVSVRGEGRRHGQEAGPGDTTDQLRPHSGPVHYCVHGAYM